MMDVTSCGSMAGSACAAFRAVGPCIYIHTYIHTYINTYIHTYIHHTYIHTYIHR